MASRQAGLIALLGMTALAGCIPAADPLRSAGRTSPSPRPTAAPSPTRHAARSASADRDHDRDHDEGRVRPVDLPGSAKQATPAWVARKVVADAAIVVASTYTVRPGDTLSAIGVATHVGADALVRANGLAAPFTVKAGQQLSVPAGRYHQVKAGESGVAIARAYGVHWSEVVALNDLQPPYLLRNGQRLLLPSTVEMASRSVEQRAQAFQLNIDDLVTGSEPALATNAAPSKPSESARKPVPASQAVAEPKSFAGRFDWPLTGRLIGRFGPAGDGRRNDGINIAADRGDPVRAAADGVVAYAGSAIAVYGGLILVKHGGGWITAYGHAEQILVTRGQAVKRGDVIARAGATGSVNAPQLHFEIRDKRAPVDPLRYLPSRS